MHSASPMAFNKTLYTTGRPRGETITQEICVLIPPKISSPGLIPTIESRENYLQYAGPGLQIQMIIILVVTQIIHRVHKYVGLPMFTSQIIAGIILGPMVLEKKVSFVAKTFDSVEVIGPLASLGYLFFLFLSGVKMDVSLINKSGWKVVCIGILTVVVPTTFGFIASYILHPDSNLIISKSAFLIINNSATSFPVIHSLLEDLKILNSQLGRLGLAAGLVGDITSLCFLNGFEYVTLAHETRSETAILIRLAMNISFVLFLVFVWRAVMKWMVKLMPEGGKIKDIFLYVIILAFMMTPFMAQFFKVFLLCVAFLLGLVVPHGHPLGSAVVEKLDPLVSGLFLPLFVTTCGMRIDLSLLYHSMANAQDNEEHVHFIQNQAITTVILHIIKFLTSFMLPLILFKMPTKDSLALAVVLTTKGIVQMGAIASLNDDQVISGDMFAIFSMFILMIASIAPIIVRRLYDPSKKYLGYQKRSIMHSKPNDELRMICCIHVPSDVNSMMNLLNIFCPTKDYPIAVDVLHLVKLCGQATPLFIAHQKRGQIQSFTRSYSESVILAFNQFEQENWQGATVNVFTAVSPPDLMYEDICNLSMDRHTSFIILPFHKRWLSDGSIESENKTIKSMNCKILEKAPCSVGILVERQQRHLKRSNFRDDVSPSNSPSYNIAMIFLGGKDDREALALAKRMAQDRSVSLTVIHLKATNNPSSTRNDNKMLDDFLLKTIKQSGYTTYLEKQVNGGAETSIYLRSIVNEYQLIIVGQRLNCEDPQTKGLHEWCDIPEIGIMGDLLSSSDFSGHYSVLIVQQQEQHRLQRVAIN